MGNTWIHRFRMRWTAATKTLGYSIDYTERMYKIYLNHNKIVHFREGHPVYSLSTPALFTKPAANLFARSVFSTIQQRPIPNLLSFAVNDICNVKCYHCSFFGGVDDKSRKVMTTEQCIKLIRDAQRLGVSVINIVGGEPTLREDLPDILRSVDKDLSTTVMFTNGLILERNIAEYRDAGLDSVYVSIDSADPVEHDRRRNLPTLFDKAMHGIARAKSLGMSVGISASLTPDDYRSGELGRMMELAKRIGVHEVVVFDVMPSGRMKEHEELVDNEGWIDDMIDSMERYNDDPSYPGVIAFAYVTSYRSTGCSCGVSYFYVSPYGDVNPCDFNHKIFGNILVEPLWKVWDRMTASEGYGHAKWGGCKIKDGEYRKHGIAIGGLSDVKHGAFCEHPVKKMIREFKSRKRVRVATARSEVQR